MPGLILGSASARRLALLASLGLRPDAVRPPEIDETPQRGERPRAYCIRMAREKAAAVEAGPDDIVLCADTTVALGRRILGKPVDAADAVRMLHLMSGRRHRVITALALRRGERLWQREVEAVVQMKRLSDAEISAYIRSGEWQGKAGAYGIQGRAGAFVPRINGSFTAIVGLPLADTMNVLRGAGYPVDSA